MSVNYNWLSKATEALKSILHVELQKIYIALAVFTEPLAISYDGNWNYGYLCFGRKDSNRQTKGKR